MRRTSTPVPELKIRGCFVAFEKVSCIWQKGTYFLIWLVTTLVVGWVYIGPLTDPGAYDPIGWVFALVFPILVGTLVAVQIANYREQKSCPINAASGGVGGGVLGIITVGCSTCPAILLGWVGLGTAIPGSLLASPWLKLVSLFLLLLSIFWTSRRS
jgi:hypothetical protein